MSTLFISKIIADYAFFGAEGVFYAQQELGCHGEPWIHSESPWVIPSEQMSVLCAETWPRSVLWLQGKAGTATTASPWCGDADLSPAQQLHRWKQVLLLL